MTTGIDTVYTIWILIGAAMILFMHSGFAMLEAGLVRVKSVGTVMLNNFTDFAICGLIFWAFGMGFMFNTDNGGFIGSFDFVAMNSNAYAPVSEAGTPLTSGIAYTIFQACIASTVPAIVGGALLERANFKATMIASCLMSGIIYPIAGHWVWGNGGWLNQLGFHDFAGGAVVHGFGGVIALIGAIVVGPRIGKYVNGKVNTFPAHNVTVSALGSFILWFGWYFFNSSCVVDAGSKSAEVIGLVFMNNTLAASAAGMVGLFISWVKDGKPNVVTCINAPLGGLVAITSCCDIVEPWAAAVIGAIAAFVIIFCTDLIDKIIKIDDPVGAVGMHYCCGMAGTLMAGFFATDGGVFYGGGGYLLGIQALGVLTLTAWGAGTALVVYLVLKFTIGLRAKREEELAGMDIASFGMKETSYPEFLQIDVDVTEEMVTPVVKYDDVAKQHTTK